MDIYQEACRNGYTVKFIRLPDILITLKGTDDKEYRKTFKQFVKPVLLIIDEWLLKKVSEDDQHNILELLEQRTQNASTIF
jgi:DNA replication protein DnaC